MEKAGQGRKIAGGKEKRLQENKANKAEGNKAQGNQRRLYHYTLEAVVIATVVVAALLLPQLIFQVQDNILCSDTELGQRESMNVEALSTTYEKSLAVRMENFAEGVLANTNYYVTSQNLTVNEELTDFLYSDKVFYSDMFTQLVNSNLISPEVWDIMAYGVVWWKQYVIYNDNYQEGVNFIVWYIELENANGAVVKLLADAEDGTIYGLKSEGSTHIWDAYWWSDISRDELWAAFAWYYQALTEDMFTMLSLAEDIGLTLFEMQENAGPAIQAEFDAMGKEIDVSELTELQERLRGRAFQFQYDEAASLTRYFLPYGETATLDAVFSMEKREDRYPDFILGISRIYEMIPEFE